VVAISPSAWPAGLRRNASNRQPHSPDDARSKGASHHHSEPRSPEDRHAQQHPPRRRRTCWPRSQCPTGRTVRKVRSSRREPESGIADLRRLVRAALCLVPRQALQPQRLLVHRDGLLRWPRLIACWEAITSSDTSSSFLKRRQLCPCQASCRSWPTRCDPFTLCSALQQCTAPRPFIPAASPSR
jgi:hypothetical protein